MKTLSGTFAFVVLAVIAIVTLPSCSRKQVSKDECPTDKKVCVKFGKPGTGTAEPEYVEVDKDEFDKALCRLNKDQYYVDFLPDAKATPIPDYTPSCDKITTSAAARTEPAEESAAYDPNVVYRVYSNSAKDIKDVVKTFKD
jgi:hypothetical protein